MSQLLAMDDHEEQKPPSSDSLSPVHAIHEARIRTYTTLRTPAEPVDHGDDDISGESIEDGDVVTAFGSVLPEYIGTLPPGGLENLRFNDLFHHCEATKRRPANRVFLKSWKSFQATAAQQHYEANPSDYIALCHDVSDYEECFWNYRENRFCTCEEAEVFDDVLEQVFQTKGSFLDDPVSDKESAEVTLSGGHSVATTTMQGWRSGHEDDGVVCPELPSHPGVALVCVLDGHGGERVAHRVAGRLASIFDECLPPAEMRQFASLPAGSAELTGAPQDLVAEGVVRAFLAADEDVEAALKSDHTGCTGTTLNTVLLTPSTYIVGNSGDSRIVLCRGGKAVRLSHDHKPDSPRESVRILKAGGVVTDGRVEGLLAVSRALGDFDFKQAGGLPARDQAVSACPDVSFHARSPDDQFLVQACDGIWDCMTDDEVCSFIRIRLAASVPPRSIVESLCDNCIAPSIDESGIGTDNMSVHCILLKN
ncbi:putative protein phosphatase 2C T23F11.1 [Diplonema papillatum]|nr:putative protein phosphatase 2C T23F11.1 [Diplonema papillatum]